MQALKIPHQTITPELAKSLLSKLHPKQRPLNKGKARQIAFRIVSGLWDENSGFIGLDSIGRVTDGQTRLTAIVMSGATVRYRFVMQEWSEHQDDSVPRPTSQRMGVSKCLAAVSRFIGKNMATVNDPDECVRRFGDIVRISGVESLAHKKPWSCAPVLSAIVVSVMDGSENGIDVYSRLAQAKPQTARESKLMDSIISGKITSAGIHQILFCELFFSAIKNKPKNIDDMRKIVDVWGAK